MNLFRKIVLIVFTCLVAEQLYAVDSVKPNVLFIAIDDLNDWVGFLDGHPQTQTPNMDRLAKRGVVFTNAHCQAPICNPSRVSLLTGTLPSTTGIYLLGPTDFRKACPLLKNAEETPTLPEHFAANGYRTIGGGKIYHGATSRETFQEYCPRGGNGAFPKRKLSYPTGVKLWDWGRFPENDGQQGITESPHGRSNNWLNRKRNRSSSLLASFDLTFHFTRLKNGGTSSGLRMTFCCRRHFLRTTTTLPPLLAS